MSKPINFKHEEIEQEINIHAVNETVRFACMGPVRLSKAVLLVNNCEIETIDVSQLYTDKYNEKVPMAIPFLDGLFLDVNKLGSVEVRCHYKGAKYPTIAYECWNNNSSPPQQTDKVKIEYVNGGLVVQCL